MASEETRASLVRRRLQELTAAYDAEFTSSPGPGARRSHAAETSWRLSPAHVRAAVGIAVAAGILMTWWVLSGRPRTAEPAPVRLTSQADHGDHPAESSVVVVDVTGKVKHPGIVTLKAGSRVHQAIAKAGGPADGADTSGINLARVLADGEQIVVGTPAAPGAAGGSVGPGASGGRVSLSSATLEQLDTLPGIGPVTAQAIIDFRTEHGGFRRVEDLLDVTGIGDQTLADLKDLVTP